MKIAHLTYDMRIGGAEFVIKTLLNDPKKDLIICLQPNLGPVGTELKSLGYTILNLQWNDGFSIKTILALRQLIKQYKIDILHCHQYTPWCYGALSTAITSTKVVFTEHGRFYPDVKHPKRRFVNPILIALTDTITTITSATKQALVDFEYIPENKITVIYNGIDIEEPKPIALHQELGIEKDKVIIATISRIDPIKNIQLVIKALNETTSLKIHLVIIGSGDDVEKSKLINLTDELGISERVSFLGFKNNPIDYLNAVDVFLLPSFNEGASMTLLQAMYLQKTTIVTRVGGTPELISNDEGFLIENDDTKELVKLLNNIDEVIQHEKKYKAKEVFAKKFTKQIMLSNYQNLYRKV